MVQYTDYLRAYRVLTSVGHGLETDFFGARWMDALETESEDLAGGVDEQSSFFFPPRLRSTPPLLQKPLSV